MSSVFHHYCLILIFCLQYDGNFMENEDSFSGFSNVTRFEQLDKHSSNCSLIDKVPRDEGERKDKIASLLVNSTDDKNNGSDSESKESKRIITSGDIHRYRIIVSGYLIIAVVFVGLVFMGITHFLGRREVRKYQNKYGLTYRPATRKELQPVDAV